MANYYYGWEGKVNLGYEWISAAQNSSYGIAVSCAEAISWLRDASATVNENTTKEWFVSTTKGRDADDSVKGQHEVNGTLTYWLPDDMDATTADDITMFKLPIDGLLNNYTNGTSFSIPSSAHGTNVLQSFTLEIGHSKSGTNNPRYLAVSGCVASSFSLRARAGERIECSMDWIGKGCTFSSGTMTTPTRSTGAPLGFENCTVKYGSSGSEAALTEATGFEFTIDNNLIQNYGLATQGVRTISDMIAGKRDITGTLTVHMASGNVTNNLYADVLGGTTPTTATTDKAIEFTVLGVAAAGSFSMAFYGVTLAEMETPIDPTKVQELSVPFAAEEIVWKFKPSAAFVSGNQPANWSQT